MKKKGEFFALLVFAILLISFVAAENQTSSDVSTKAYSCLNDLVNGKCSSLTTEQKIFSLLSIQSCKSELISDSLANECWPQTGCNIKTTSQAILALNKVNTDTSKAEQWLLSQTMNYPNIDWFLQIDAKNGTTCKASYSGGSYTFSINDDKSLSGGAGGCLELYNNYWLKISSTSSCYDQQFQISCSNSFITSLLYEKKGSVTVYVSDKTHSASAEGSTTEKASSSCFKEGGNCNYEGTLWAALVLKYKGYDISPYLPYLTSLAEDNTQYLPDSFLYSLTNNFRTELLTQQQESKWWAVSGDKFYDTAVALFPFPNEQLAEKTNSISWLQEVQGTDGCWQDNIRNTAFLLYSLWPKVSSVIPSLRDCTSSNYFCISDAACTAVGGNKMANYTGCFATNICCDKQQQLQSCSDQNGRLCDSDQQCLGGNKVSSSDSTGSQFCCVDGTCGVSQRSECDVSGGICKASCSDTEQISSYSCSSSFVCCTEKPQGSSLWIVIVLAILIILVVIGIIFRKKLREFFSKFKFKFRFGKGKGKPSGGPRLPPTSSQRVYPGAIQRRIFPQRGVPVRRPVPQNKEFDDVLKKLKEIGK